MVESVGSNEVTNVSVLATSVAEEMSEAVPSGQRSSASPVASRVVAVSSLPSSLLGIFGTGDQIQEALKTTHIVIHDQSAALLQKAAPLTPLTPSNTSPLVPLLQPFPSVNTRTTNTPTVRKYTWDPSVLDPVLPVRCRNIGGELHKDRFGSGSRGKCILVESEWYTPSEFEALCGRGNSKDWKRSIRYAGRTLQCLIEEGFLQPHATSCTCASCCSENTMVVSSDGNTTPNATSGPIRLFTPYKRRRRQEKQQATEQVSIASAAQENATTLAPADIQLQPVDIQVSTAGPSIVEVPPESVIVTPAATPQTPRSAPTALDFAEQRQWWQLEEMVKNIVRQAQELQKQVETAKAQSAAARDAALQQLRIQMENEKKEALNTSRVEAQMKLSRAVLEVKTEKELAVEKALQQARQEMQEKLDSMVADRGESNKRCANCDRDAYSECTGCRRVSYCSTFCQRKDWQNHQEECGESTLSSDCIEELVEQPVE